MGNPALKENTVTKRFAFSFSAKLPNDAAEFTFGVHSDDYDRGLEIYLDGLRRIDTDHINNDTIVTPTAS